MEHLLVFCLRSDVAVKAVMQIKRSDQPPKEVARKVTLKMQPLLYP